MKERNPSPLRYPGGKAPLAGILEEILYANNLQGCTYIEPFAGGAGAGIRLMLDGHVDRIIINDVDKAVFSFWRSVMRYTDDLVDRIRTTPLSIPEWRRQREIYLNPRRGRYLDLGFAAFYLNRCNRSGIIKNAGPIGGVEQTGRWKIDARFNRNALVERVESIAAFGDRIQVLREDARMLVKKLPDCARGEQCFIYADPPYYMKGRDLYLSHYNDSDHVSLARTMRATNASWIMTYDNVDRIKEIYDGLSIHPFALRYSAHHSSTEGGEVLIAPPSMIIPQTTVALLRQTSGFFRELPSDGAN